MEKLPLKPKQIRWLELLLVLSVAFANIFVTCFYYLFKKDVSFFGSGPGIVSMIIHEGLSLSLVFYVLFRQGRSAKDIGFGFQRKDILHSFGLFLLAYAAYYVFFLVGYYGFHYFHWTAREAASRELWSHLFPNGFSISLLMLVLVNPFFEEFIVRAFAISEITFLTGRPFWAVAASIILQFSYHLYQGPLNALSGVGIWIIFSLYFIKYKRILPVILAHGYFDGLAVFIYS